MKIFFNNSCSICRSEINVYKKQGIKQLEWVDITNNKDAEIDTKKTNKDLLRRLHVKSDGIECQNLNFLVNYYLFQLYFIFFR